MRHLYGRVTIDMAEARALEDARFYQRKVITDRLMKECGLTRFRAEKYARRAVPSAWAMAIRQEIRVLIEDIRLSGTTVTRFAAPAFPPPTSVLARLAAWLWGRSSA